MKVGAFDKNLLDHFERKLALAKPKAQGRSSIALALQHFRIAVLESNDFFSNLVLIDIFIFQSYPHKEHH